MLLTSISSYQINQGLASAVNFEDNESDVEYLKIKYEVRRLLEIFPTLWFAVNIFILNPKNSDSIEN